MIDWLMLFTLFLTIKLVGNLRNPLIMVEKAFHHSD